MKVTLNNLVAVRLILIFFTYLFDHSKTEQLSNLTFIRPYFVASIKLTVIFDEMIETEKTVSSLKPVRFGKS